MTPRALTYLGSCVAVTTDANTGLEASTGYGIRPLSVLRREDFGAPRGTPVIVSQPQTITWAVSLNSIVIGERLATALSGACMPFRRSPS